MKDFKKIVFHICNELNGSVIDFYKAGITPNFHTAHIRVNDTDLFVLCSYEGHWAYSSIFPLSENAIDFIDFREFSKLLFQYYEIKPHQSKELLSPFTNKFNSLDYDIKYWKPKREGEALFNWWD